MVNFWRVFLCLQLFVRMLRGAYMKLTKLATWASSAFMSLYTPNSPSCGPSVGSPADNAADDATGNIALMFQVFPEFSKLCVRIFEVFCLKVL